METKSIPMQPDRMQNTKSLTQSQQQNAAAQAPEIILALDLFAKTLNNLDNKQV